MEMMRISIRRRALRDARQTATAKASYQECNDSSTYGCKGSLLSLPMALQEGEAAEAEAEAEEGADAEAEEEAELKT